MNRLSLPLPPVADDQMYRSNPLAFNRAMTSWAQRTKGLIENAHNGIPLPCGQQIQVADFTTNTAASGTYVALADVNNVLCTLIQILTDSGHLSPNITRES
jgi:hypothetical protein